MKRIIIFLVVILLLLIAFFIFKNNRVSNSLITVKKILPTPTLTVSNPLQIQAMRERSYPGSDIKIEQTLPDGLNYHQYLTSYVSDGLKIYALLTVPFGQKPTNGWPVIVFNHGYITPSTYQTFPTVGQYATYYPPFAKAGYIVFKPDYRGNGNSQGSPEGAYYSPAYTVDDLNAIVSIKKYPDADPNKIGVWGHSMGGNITLRDLVVDPKDIKVAVIWGGVVGSYEDLQNWHDPSYHPSAYELALRYRFRQDLQDKYGSPSANSPFWSSIDPTNYLSDITAPVQLHVGDSDEEVPTFFSLNLYNKLKTLNKTVEFYEYPGANHNISQGFDLAMQRSLQFFDKYLK